MTCQDGIWSLDFLCWLWLGSLPNPFPHSSLSVIHMNNSNSQV